MDYLKERSWHGLSCPCGGRYRVGHAIGCEFSIPEDNLAQLAIDLDRARQNDDQDETADLTRIRSEIEAVAARSANGN